ncbi:MAG: cupin domain-containing protein [Candidatus Nanopelagicales bacterium]|jgi:quercetin dioxygenase-like cupin family protein
MSAAATAAVVSRRSDRSPLRWTFTETIDVVLGPAQSGGSLALVEHRLCFGDGTPLYVNDDSAEVCYVLAGRVALLVDGSRVDAGEGDAVWLPPGRAHAIACVSDGARILLLTTARGFGSFVRAASLGSTVPGDEDADLDGLLVAAAGSPSRVGPPPGLVG